MDFFIFQGGLIANLFFFFFLFVCVVLFTISVIQALPSSTTTSTTTPATTKSGGLFHRVGIIVSLLGALLGADAYFFSFSYTNTAKTYIVMVGDIISEVAAHHSAEEVSSAHSSHPSSLLCEEGDYVVEAGVETDAAVEAGVETDAAVEAGVEYRDGFPILYNHFSSYSQAFHAATVLKVKGFWWRNPKNLVYLSGTKKGAPPSSQPFGIDCAGIEKGIAMVVSPNISAKLDEAMPPSGGIQPKKYPKLPNPNSFDRYVKTERMLGRPAMLCRN